MTATLRAGAGRARTVAGVAPQTVDVTARARWGERWRRPGWDLIYTHLGGSLRRLDPLAQLTGPRRSAARRRTGQVLLAVTSGVAEPDADVAYFVTVARKLLQRGRAPVVPPAVEELLLTADALAAAKAAGPDAWFAAVVGPPTGPVVLDPAVQLDPVYEQPLWEQVRRHHPQLAAYLTPQAPFEPLAGATDGQQWVDFLLACPWLPTAAVIELDGAQHHDTRRVDDARDTRLRRAGHTVARYAGRRALDPAGDLAARLRRTAELRPPPADPALTRLVHGPATVTRLAAALVELLAAGHLRPGGTWDLEVADPFGIAHEALGPVLGMLAAVAEVWSLTVAPDTVLLDGCVWTRTGSGYRRSVGTDPAPRPRRETSRVRVRLEPFVAAHADLGVTRPGVAEVVIRGTYLPLDLPWLAGISRERRNVSAEPTVDSALRQLGNILFGHLDFRPGQLAALRGALSDHDEVVLLPTGAGKSLIYQMAGLLRPGVTLVVDPIVSLIDDQERRLRADGVDRVSALHAGRVATADDRDHAYAAIAGGHALFVFLTPERLQSQTFRDALGRAAEQQLVNLAVVDEAHCVSEWGHDFRTAYLRLGKNLRRLSRSVDGQVPPLLALTGTASPAVLRDVIRELEHPGRPVRVQRPDSFDRANLTYRIVAGAPDSLWARLRHALTREVCGTLGCQPEDLARLDGRRTLSGLVFVPHARGEFGVFATQKAVRAALAPAPDQHSATAATEAGPSRSAAGAGAGAGAVEVYSGSAPAPELAVGWERRKADVAGRFTGNETAVLVATKAFGMGIDKPNIRWTVHLGFPSSIEAFAQEAGRAGRDGAPACCVIVATPAQAGRARQLLDLQASREVRRKTFAAVRANDDLQRQLYFLNASFAGVDDEYAAAEQLLGLLLPGGPGRRVEVPRAVRAEDAQAQEKALYRLSMIGVVDDYTVDYAAKRFVVEVAPFDGATVDEAVLRFVTRVEPGKTGLRRRQLTHAPADVPGRARHHLRLVLDTLYAVVEPARLRALAEMAQLASGRLSDDDVRERMLAFLSDGPLSGILLDLAVRDRLDVREALRILDTVPAEDPREWVGAAARQLEAYPDHPVLLLVRALGEALLTEGDDALVVGSAASAFDALSSYDVPGHEAAFLFGWAAGQLRSLGGGGSWAKVALLWQAWSRSGLDERLLADVESQVLELAADGELHPAEVRLVLGRRLQRVVGTVEKVTVALTGTAAPTGVVTHSHDSS